jgi:aminoglycoside phosphotransferase (APT) family kinase protein
VTAPRVTPSPVSVTFAAWCCAIEEGTASYAALMRWRHRLATNEFPPGPDRELMALRIGDALAAMLDCEARDLPEPPGLGGAW